MNPLTPRRSWNDLPDLVFKEVFSYLSPSDLVHASAVSRSWCRATEMPTLWRSVIVWFNGLPTDISKMFGKFGEKDTTPCFCDSKAHWFVEKYGEHLKRLNIVCNPMDRSTSGNVQIKISKFLKRLKAKGCILRELMMSDISLINSPWMCFWEPAARKDFIESFAEFFSSQYKLERVHFGPILNADDTVLLRSLANSSSSLKSLHMLFNCHIDQERRIQEAYSELFSRMTNLQNIVLSLETLDNSVLKAIAQCQNLKIISIYVLRFPLHIIPPEDWQLACKHLPQLKVKFEGVLWIQYSQFPMLFVPHMPLMSVYAKFDVDAVPHSNWNFNRVLDYISDNFFETLAILTVRTDTDMDNIDVSLKRLLVTCSKLRELTVQAQVSLETVEEICILQKENKIDLQMFWMLPRGYTAEEAIMLEDTYSKYKDVIGNRNWEFTG